GLHALVHDFRGDVCLARDLRKQAQAEFQLAEQWGRSTIRDVAYARYSQAKWLLAQIDPAHQALNKDDAQTFEQHAGSAERLFGKVGDESGLGMVRLLRAQADMVPNPVSALEDLKKVCPHLERHGPRRHLALALFRLTQLVIAQRSNPQFEGEHPIPYL